MQMQMPPSRHQSRSPSPTASPMLSPIQRVHLSASLSPAPSPSSLRPVPLHLPPPPSQQDEAAALPSARPTLEEGISSPMAAGASRNHRPRLGAAPPPIASARGGVEWETRNEGGGGRGGAAGAGGDRRGHDRVGTRAPRHGLAEVMTQGSPVSPVTPHSPASPTTPHRRQEEDRHLTLVTEQESLGNLDVLWTANSGSGEMTAGYSSRLKEQGGGARGMGLSRAPPRPRTPQTPPQSLFIANASGHGGPAPARDERESLLTVMNEVEEERRGALAAGGGGGGGGGGESSADASNSYVSHVGAVRATPPRKPTLVSRVCDGRGSLAYLWLGFFCIHNLAFCDTSVAEGLRSLLWLYRVSFVSKVLRIYGRVSLYLCIYIYI